jgi:hypothetical protein
MKRSIYSTNRNEFLLICYWFSGDEVLEQGRAFESPLLQHPRTSLPRTSLPHACFSSIPSNSLDWKSGTLKLYTSGLTSPLSLF